MRFLFFTLLLVRCSTSVSRTNAITYNGVHGIKRAYLAYQQVPDFPDKISLYIVICRGEHPNPHHLIPINQKNDGDSNNKSDVIYKALDERTHLSEFTSMPKSKNRDCKIMLGQEGRAFTILPRNSKRPFDWNLKSVSDFTDIFSIMFAAVKFGLRTHEVFFNMGKIETPDMSEFNPFYKMLALYPKTLKKESVRYPQNQPKYIADIEWVGRLKSSVLWPFTWMTFVWFAWRAFDAVQSSEEAYVRSTFYNHWKKVNTPLSELESVVKNFNQNHVVLERKFMILFLLDIISRNPIDLFPLIEHYPLSYLSKVHVKYSVLPLPPQDLDQ
jgi:hypothetical protein